MKQRTESVIWKKRRRKPPGRAAKKKKRIFFLKKESLRNILDNMKHNNRCIMGIPEGEESEQESRNYLKK